MKSVLTLFALLTILLLPACAASVPSDAVPAVAETNQPEVTQSSPAAVQPGVEAPLGDLPPLNSADPAGLAYVREEEKLAYDVYLFLFDRWGLQVFQNIATGEQTHTETVRSLLASYGLEDPAAASLAGVFADPDLQALYDQLIIQSGLSLAEALKVGAAIEEIDILDLQARLAGNLPDDVRLVYENLLSGSYNHLSAFTSTLARQTGEGYAPLYLSADSYQQALALASTGGNGNGNGYRGGH